MIKNYFKLLSANVCIMLLLFSCATMQTKKEDNNLTLMPKLSYFNPKSTDEKINKENIDINVLSSKKPNEIKNWNITVKNSKDETVFTSANKSDIENTFVWDGKDFSNKISADGSYYAALTINNNLGNPETFKSKTFSIDTMPPKVNVSVAPALFSPDNDGIDDMLSINLTADDITGIKNWAVSIMTPDGKKDFIIFNGNGAPKDKISWDGKSSSGEIVESAEDYPVTVRVENNLGAVFQKNFEPIHVDILATKMPDGSYKIKVSNILFKENSAELTDSLKNMDIINKLSLKLQKFPKYSIKVAGYVNPFITDMKYNEEVAKKLSEDRASTIAKLLDQHGIDIKRITAIGKGGADPIATPATNTQNDKNYLEKNRRVEFYLNK